MKKVICVDEDAFTGITKGNEYPVINETDGSYIIKNDRGNEIDYSKDLFRPVPEAEYQYGQEVEVGDDGISWKRTLYGCLNPDKSQFKYLTSHGAFNYIRPVQSMRDKVREYMDYNNIMIEDIQIDRIIELVKNEKI